MKPGNDLQMPIRSTLHEYQENIAFELSGQFYGMLAMDPGTGKSLTVLRSIYHLMDETLTGTVVIVLPKGVLTNFAREVYKHLGNTYPVNCITKQSGQLIRECHINFIPFSIVHNIVGHLQLNPYVNIDVLIVDEAHYCRNPKTRLCRSIQELANISTYMWLLTGTPIVNYQKDLQVLQSFKPEHECPIYTAHKSMVLDLLPIQYYKVQFPNNPVKKYTSSSIALARITQQRVASTQNPHKWKYIKEVLLPREEPTIIFTSYKTAALGLMDYLGTNLGINGDMSSSQRDGAIATFQAHGGVIVCTYDAAGVGINLTKAKNVVCVDPPWNAAKLNQAVDRAHRIGQVNQINVYFLQQPNETWIYGIVGLKQAIAVEELQDIERLPLTEEMNAGLKYDDEPETEHDPELRDDEEVDGDSAYDRDTEDEEEMGEKKDGKEEMGEA